MKEILGVLNQGRLGEQLLRQEDLLRALVFFDLLEACGITMEPLTDEGPYIRLNLDDLPPLAIDVLFILEQLPRLFKIEEWAVFEPLHRVDPILAFRVGPKKCKRWFSVCRW